MGSEVWRCGDEDACFDDFGDLIEGTDFFLECGQGVEGALAGALNGGGLVDLGGDDSFCQEGAVFDGDLA